MSRPINNMGTKLHVVMLSYKHHRRTPKARSVREAITSRRTEEKQELSEEKGQNVEHTYKAEQVYKTLHVKLKKKKKERKKSATILFYATAGIVAYMHIDQQTPSNF